MSDQSLLQKRQKTTCFHPSNSIKSNFWMCMCICAIHIPWLNSSGIVKSRWKDINAKQDYLCTKEHLSNLCRIKNKNSWDKVSTLWGYLNTVWNGVLDAENPLQGTNRKVVLKQYITTHKKAWNHLKGWPTCIVFRKSFGSSGSSKG